MLELRQLVLRDLADRTQIHDADIADAHAHAGKHQTTILQALIELERITHRDLALARARVCEHPYVDLSRYDVDTANASIFPGSVAARAAAFPIFVSDAVATVGMTNPHNLQALDLLRQSTHHEIEPVVCDEDIIWSLIAEAYAEQTPEVLVGEREDTAAQTGDPVLDTLNSMLRRALAEGASGVHINPEGARSAVHFRVGGELCRDSADPGDAHALIQRLKVLCGMDHTASGTPQQGRLAISEGTAHVNAWAGIVPVSGGESVVIRFGEPDQTPRSIKQLGMPSDAEACLRELLGSSHGLLLFSGGFGSGRTTTLTAAVAELVSPSRHILTIEDPPEIGLQGVRQMSVGTAGLTPASAMRLATRQDPDVIVLGEIQGPESARAAVRAASTGHFVLATIDADSPEGTKERLAAMGVARSDIDNVLVGIVNHLFDEWGRVFEILRCKGGARLRKRSA